MYIRVKVNPSAKEDKLEVIKDNEFKISVKAKAERNLANSKVIEMVAQYLQIPESRVMIINGHHTPTKLLSIRD